MKKSVPIIAICLVFFINHATAQDSTKAGLKKQINSSNEKADNLRGKNMQQQSLSTQSFEKLDTATAKTIVKKPGKKRPMKQAVPKKHS